jgi:hypothetical protein
MINAKLQNIIDTKSAIGNAINNKGGSITVDTPFYEYAPAIENISTGGGAYSTWVIQDENNANYQFFNGYDFVQNPNPSTTNLIFNVWLRNNSASGSIILSNTVMEAKTYNGPNSTVNITQMPLTSESNSYGGSIRGLAINNGFIYAGGAALGGVDRGVGKYYASNLALFGNTVNYGGGGIITSVVVNNNFIYAGGGFGNQTIQKFHEGNLIFNIASASVGLTINAITINNGFVYITANNARKYHESNLVFSSQTSSITPTFKPIITNNSFVYVGVASGSSTELTVRKYHESNLVFVGQTASYNGALEAIAINNGFIYSGGETTRTVRKYGESNLSFIGNTADYGGTIKQIKISNGFIYVSGDFDQRVKKYYESNLVFVGNTDFYGGNIWGLVNDGNFVFAGGFGDTKIKKYFQNGVNPDNRTYYIIKNVKE